MNFFEVLKKRKSTRQFKPNNISDDHIQQLLEAAWTAPVARGVFDNYHITVITNQEIIHAIQEYDSVIKNEASTPLFDAPLLFLVSVKNDGNAITNSEYSSAAMIIHNIALAATALNLGHCDIWGAINRANDNQEIVNNYQLLEGFTVTAGIVVGELEEPLGTREITKDKIKTTFIK